MKIEKLLTGKYLGKNDINTGKRKSEVKKIESWERKSVVKKMK